MEHLNSTSRPAGDGVLHLPVIETPTRAEIAEHIRRMVTQLPELVVGLPMKDARSAVTAKPPPSHLLLIAFLLEWALGGDPRARSTAAVAEMAFLAQMPGAVQVMIVHLALGQESAHRHARAVEARLIQASADGVDLYDEIADMGRSGRGSRAATTRLILGRAEIPPDPARLENSIPLLRHIAGAAPISFRVSLLLVLAWVHWALDKRALAAVYLREVERLGAEDNFSRMIRRLIESPRVPTWIRG